MCLDSGGISLQFLTSALDEGEWFTSRFYPLDRRLGGAKSRQNVSFIGSLRKAESVQNCNVIFQHPFALYRSDLRAFVPSELLNQICSKISLFLCRRVSTLHSGNFMMRTVGLHDVWG
jgi:hypothetical protein